MKTWFLICLIAIIFSDTALALHCSNRVVLQGYNQDKVLDLCGEPEFVEHAKEYIDRYEYEISEKYTKGLRLKRRGLRLKHETEHLIPIHYELWTYISDQNLPTLQLEFRNGVLFNIEHDSYVYDQIYGY
ncbi:MAG: DUF2845 domain-containing protein [Methylococcales bacterium]